VTTIGGAVMRIGSFGDAPCRAALSGARIVSATTAPGALLSAEPSCAHQLSVHKVRVSTSLMKIRLPANDGSAHVACSATLYFFSISNAAGVFLHDDEFAVVFQADQRVADARDARRWSPDGRRTATASCRWRHPRAKYWPMLRFDSPNSMSPASTMLVLRSGLSAFSHTFVVVHAVRSSQTVNATVGPASARRDDGLAADERRIRVRGAGIDDTAAPKAAAPVASSTPTIFFCVIVTTCRVPPRSAMIGEP
jgi:hypothetical protein